MSIKDVNPDHLFRSMQGHGSPKKSKAVHLPGNPDPILWLKRQGLATSLRAAAQRKRTRLARKNLHNPSQPKPVKAWPACPKRYLEFEGLPAFNFAYTAPPRLIAPFPKKVVYELWRMFQPYCTFTDAREAEQSCIALQQNGWPNSWIIPHPV